MSVFQVKPQRALSSARPAAAAKAAGVSLGRIAGKDALIPRYRKHDSVAATSAVSIEIDVVRQANNTTEPTSTFVTVWFSTSKEGPKNATVTYGPLNSGTLVATPSANQMYQFQTTEDGYLSFDLTKATAGTVYVRCQIGGQVVTEAYVWT